MKPKTGHFKRNISHHLESVPTPFFIEPRPQKTKCQKSEVLKSTNGQKGSITLV